MEPSIEAGWVSRRRHLILLIGVVALQIVQPLLMHDSVAHRVLYDAAFGAIVAQLVGMKLVQAIDPDGRGSQ